MPAHGDADGDDDAVARVRWWQRALPVSALALALLAGAALALPAVREQVALSATHRPQQYAELAFGRVDGVPLVCTSRPRAVRVAFEVTSHFDEARELTWVARVGSATRSGDLEVASGATAAVTATLPRPAERRFPVTVRLPELDLRLHGRCGGGAR